VLQHIISRGIERRKIFLSDVDRDDFVDRLSRIMRGAETLCYACALIPNHSNCFYEPGICRLPRSYAGC